MINDIELALSMFEERPATLRTFEWIEVFRALHRSDNPEAQSAFNIVRGAFEQKQG